MNKEQIEHAARRRVQIALLIALRAGDRCAKASSEWLLATMDERDAAHLLMAMKNWEGAISWIRPGVPRVPLPRMQALAAVR